MSLTPNRQRRPARSGHMRPVRWNVWELALLAVSLVLIASPLLAAGYALVAPTVAPAAPITLAWPTAEPTNCPDGPCAPPTFTAIPTATNTPIPPPTNTPAPTNTPGPTSPPAPTSAPCGDGYPIPCAPTCQNSAGYPIPCPTPTATPTTAPTPTAEPLPTAAPTAPPQPTTVPPTPAPTTAATSAPVKTLGLLKEALDLNGQAIAVANVGDELFYSIRVDNAVAVAVPIQLTDTFPAGIDGVSIAAVEHGTCSITPRTLSCTMQPSQNKSATALFRVRVTSAQGGSILNVAQAVDASSGETATGSVGVMINDGTTPPPPVDTAPIGSPAATPFPVSPATPIPVSPATPVPAKPANPQPAKPAPAAPPRSEPSAPEPAPSEPAPAAPQPAPVAPEPVPHAPEPTAVPEPTAAPAPPVVPKAPATPKPAAPEQQVTPKPAPPEQQVTPKPAAPSPTKAAVRKQAVPSVDAQPAATSTPAPTATPGPTMAPVTTPAPNRPSMRFNLNSDWGQVFVGDTFEYVITLQNAGNAAGGTSPFSPRARKPSLEKLLDIPAVSDVVISDELDPHFEIVEVTASGMKVTTKDRKVEAVRATLAGGETVTVKIKVRARAVDVSGKMILNQAALTYKDAEQTLFSNVVAVKVVLKNVPTPTAAPTTVPTATPEPAAAAAAPSATLEPFGERAELPHTSGGAPVWGVVLLGLTLLLHSIRVHRARIRI